jgi:hypothetical protein
MIIETAAVIFWGLNFFIDIRFPIARFSVITANIFYGRAFNVGPNNGITYAMSSPSATSGGGLGGSPVSLCVSCI